jgi:hypothetical protein
MLRSFSPVFEAALGAALAGMSLLWFRRGRKPGDRDPAHEPAAGSGGARRQVPPPLRIRGLLLLNLAPSEGRAEIETAPPIGPRHAVIDAILAIAPGIRFDDRGRGELAGDGHRLHLELGQEDPVAAVVATAEGGPGVEMLRTLMETHRWRGYAPRIGRFIDPDGLDFFALPDDRSPESLL